MDLYSIQNSGGEVYGLFPIPGEDDLDSSEWQGLLTEQLRDVLGINGVRSGKITPDGIEHDRAVIDLDPYRATPETVDRVHLAVGFIGLAAARRG